MYYVIEARYYHDDGKFHCDVAVVWGENRKEAYSKGQNIFSSCDVYDFKIKPLELETIRTKATRGGMVVVSIEEFFE